MERSRRSWHLYEMVSLGGCPGFKGPDPQPVSMSSAKSRVNGRIRSRKRATVAAPDAEKRPAFLRLSEREPIPALLVPHQCINVLIH